MESEELIICRECGDPTNNPPFEEWKGLCPECVIKTMVLPLIHDENLRHLVEMKSSEVISINLVASDMGPDELINHLKQMLKDQKCRDKLREILDMYDAKVKAAKEDVIKVNQPVVRNNPRTS